MHVFATEHLLPLQLPWTIAEENMIIKTFCKYNICVIKEICKDIYILYLTSNTLKTQFNQQLNSF